VLLKIRPFRKGFDEDVFVSIFNAVFGDYDGIRSMTLEEMKKMEDSPSFNMDGMLIALRYVDDMNPTNAIKIYEKLGFKALRNNIIY
jgi:hypothetical protein